MAEWVALHKRMRPLIASVGWSAATIRTPRSCSRGSSPRTGSEAYYVVATVDTLATQSPAPVRLPGLDPARRYRVRSVTPAGHRHLADLGESWLDGAAQGEGETLSGSALGAVGVRLPVLAPESAYVLHLTEY